VEEIVIKVRNTLSRLWNILPVEVEPQNILRRLDFDLHHDSGCRRRDHQDDQFCPLKTVPRKVAGFGRDLSPVYKPCPIQGAPDS
jgi:hypothetical protein